MAGNQNFCPAQDRARLGRWKKEITKYDGTVAMLRRLFSQVQAAKSASGSLLQAKGLVEKVAECQERLDSLLPDDGCLVSISLRISLASPGPPWAG